MLEKPQDIIPMQRILECLALQVTYTLLQADLNRAQQMGIWKRATLLIRSIQQLNMFLTGQMFARPWEEPQRQQELPKDQKFYSTKDNLWNNPHRTASQKIKGYYHEPEEYFKKTHFSDQEIKNMQKQERDEATKYRSQQMRLQSRDRLSKRTSERETLQFKSNQPVSDVNVEEIGDLANTEPQLFNELALKRSITYKDPEKPKQPNMQMWNLINQFPTYQINKVIRPKILEMDKAAVQLIQEKIESDKRSEELQKLWYQNNRDDIRSKFIQRHEKNIVLEQKTGVKKKYQAVYDSQATERRGEEQLLNFDAAQQSEPQIANDATLNDRATFNDSKLRRPASAYPPNSSGITLNQKLQTKTKTLENFGLVQDTQSEDQHNGTITFRNHPEIGSSPRALQPNGVQDQTANQSVKSKQGSAFRISTLTKPQIYKPQPLFDRLKEPKKLYEPKQPFLQRDFRGLLSADFAEAIQNCSLPEAQELGEILSSEGVSKKKSLNVKELFPLPMHNFSAKTVSIKPPVSEFVTEQNDANIMFSQKTLHQPTQSTGGLIQSGNKISRPIQNNYLNQIMILKHPWDRTILVYSANFMSRDCILQVSLTLQSICKIQLTYNERLRYKFNRSVIEILSLGDMSAEPEEKAYLLWSSRKWALSILVSEYTNTRLGSASSKPGQFMRNAKLSERLSTTNRYKQQPQTVIDEAEEAEMQIDWFEHNNIDRKKQNRYAKINLEEAYNYKERFAQQMAIKKEKMDTHHQKPPRIDAKTSSSPTSQRSPSGSKLHQPSTYRSNKKYMQHSHNVSNKIAL